MLLLVFVAVRTVLDSIWVTVYYYYGLELEWSGVES